MQTPPHTDHDMSATLMWVVDHLMKMMQRLSAIEARLVEGDKRMSRMEQKAKQARIPTAISFAKEVASIKEWLLGAAFVVMAIRGILQPAEMKAIFLSALEAMLK